MSSTLSRKRLRKQRWQAIGKNWREVQYHFRAYCSMARLAYKLNERIRCQTPQPQHWTTHDPHPNT
jgi:hypothetical protein